MDHRIWSAVQWSQNAWILAPRIYTPSAVASHSARLTAEMIIDWSHIWVFFCAFPCIRLTYFLRLMRCRLAALCQSAAGYDRHLDIGQRTPSISSHSHLWASWRLNNLFAGVFTWSNVIQSPYMPYRPFYGRQSTRTVPLALGNHTIRHCQKTAVYRKTPVKCTAVAVYGMVDSPMAS